MNRTYNANAGHPVAAAVQANCAALLSTPEPQPFLAQIMKNGDTLKRL
jgi:hypothetical protein